MPLCVKRRAKQWFLVFQNQEQVYEITGQSYWQLVKIWRQILEYNIKVKNNSYSFKEKGQNQRSHTLKILFLVTFVSLLGSSSLISILPIIAEGMKVSLTHVGLLITVYSIPGITYMNRRLAVIAYLYMNNLTQEKVWTQNTVDNAVTYLDVSYSF